VSLLWNNMTYVQITHRFRGFKLTFADWFKCSLIEELTYEIDFKKKCWPMMRQLDWKPPLRCSCLVWSFFQGTIFKVTLPYLFLIRRLTRQLMVVHLFFALTVSIRWRLLYPTLCWSINTKCMVCGKGTRRDVWHNYACSTIWITDNDNTLCWN
jgi:hypothetical protein